MRPTLLSLLVLVCSASANLLLAACTLPPRHEYELAPGRGFTKDMRSALLIPINQTQDLPDGLQKGEDLTERSIIEYLETRSLELETVEVDVYRETTAEALYAARRNAMSGRGRSASETIEYSDLVPHLVESLAPTVDLVIVPNMVLRVSQSKGGRSDHWDGVRRRIPGTSNMRMTGTGSSASLFVVIYDARGERMFSGYGGLDVLFAVNARKEKMELIPDRLENPRHIREGVCVAFHPFFDNESCL